MRIPTDNLERGKGMTPEEMIRLAKNFYYSHTYVALALAAGSAAFLYFRPKAALKTFGAIFIFLLAIYSFSILGKSSDKAMRKEKEMVNQTVDKLR